MKSRLLIMLLAVVLVATAIIFITKHNATSQPPAHAEEAGHEGHGHEAGEEAGHDAEDDAHGGIDIAGLTTAPAVLTSVVAQLTVTGEVQPDEEHMAKVGSSVSGRLTQLSAIVGQRVRQGQTLAVVSSRDVADAQSSLIRARAEEKAARQRLEHVRAMAKAGALTRKPLEEAQSAHAATVNDLAQAKGALARAVSDRDAARANVERIRKMADTKAFNRPLEEAQNTHGAAVAAMKQAESALARARSARELAANALERTQKLADANAYQARPVEEAKGAVAATEAELTGAQASVKVRQSAYDRSRRLFESGIASRREVESAEADLEEARAKEKAARTHLEVARQALAREEKIAGQHLYTSSEVQQARQALQHAEKEVEQAEAEVERVRGHLSVAKAVLDREERLTGQNVYAGKEIQQVEAAARQADKDVDSAEADVARATRHLAIAQAVLDRESRIAGQNLLARKEVQDAESSLALASDDVNAAENALRALRAAGASGNAVSIPITAPISGIVTERQATPGQSVEASTDLFTIVDTRHVWVWANVYEKDLAKVQKGQPAEISVTAHPGTVFHGTVSFIGEGLNQETRTARIRCEVPNPDGALKAGMFATVNLATGQTGNALLIPKAAVLDDAGKKIVFSPCMDCEEDAATGKSCGSFDKAEVTLGATHGDRVEIVRGLEAGAQVVTTGQYQLKTALGSGKLEAGCADEH